MLIKILVPTGIVLAVCIIALIVKSRKPKEVQWMHTGGVITDIKQRETDEATMVTISYTVKNLEYNIREALKMRDVPIKVGEVTVGYKQEPGLKIKVGQPVTICFQRNKPSVAQWLENRGV